MVQSLNVKTDFDLQGDGLVWYARPQLFFNCTMCPTGAKGFSDSYKEVSLVHFSTLEPIELTPDSIMQQAGVPMLYDSASNPRLPCPLFLIYVLKEHVLASQGGPAAAGAIEGGVEPPGMS